MFRIVQGFLKGVSDKTKARAILLLCLGLEGEPARSIIVDDYLEQGGGGSYFTRVLERLVDGTVPIEHHEDALIRDMMGGAWEDYPLVEMVQSLACITLHHLSLEIERLQG